MPVDFRTLQKGLPRLLLIALRPRRGESSRMLVFYKLANIAKPTKKRLAVQAARLNSDTFEYVLVLCYATASYKSTLRKS